MATPTFHAMAAKAAAAVKIRRDAEQRASGASLSRGNTAAILAEANIKQERVAKAREALEKKEETAKKRRISLS